MTHFLNFTLLPPLCYSLKITTNYGMRKKFFSIYGCFSVSCHIKGGRKSCRYNRIFRHACMLSAVLLSELRENPRRKYWVTEEKYIARICVKDIIFWLHAPPSLLSLFLSTPFPKKYLHQKMVGKGGWRPPGTQCLRPCEVVLLEYE